MTTHRILPTPVRLNAPPDLTGKGVTVAFLDAGFYAHPDLMQPYPRIKHYEDLVSGRSSLDNLLAPNESSWHGMMTSVVACGNGFLSGGVYRGLASDADVVLVKVGHIRRVQHDDIRRGLDWVFRHRAELDIRIVNISVGGDYEASYLHDALSRSAERLVRAGVFVCAAAGNVGQDTGHGVLPPASAPSVLAVGGLDDKNQLAFDRYGMYHSSYGPTIDGLQKPEVIAPGIWVAAPILPGTPTAAQAELLARLHATDDEALREVLLCHGGIDETLDAAAHLDPLLIRQVVETRLRDHSVISGAYKHVDGTSFAAPIVSSVAALMLEANPGLTPQDLRRLLIRTATRLPNVPSDRQGWGVVRPDRAVAAARMAQVE